MRRDYLHVWYQGKHVGVFSGNFRTATFTYDSDAPIDISHSLSRHEHWNNHAPWIFLQNLLPESLQARRAMQNAFHAINTSPFTLLPLIDSTGGLVFTSDDQEPNYTTQKVALARPEDIAQQITQLQYQHSHWWKHDEHNRFSLGGWQSKFTLAHIDGDWYWPNAFMPSTHILKPVEQYYGALDAEAATQHLASHIGVIAAQTQIRSFAGVKSLVSTRFDRIVQNNHVERILQEDFVQALGISYGDKYKVTAHQCAQLLHHIDQSDALLYQWVQQLVFNVCIGNADAHGRNYSLLEGSRLAPLYDAIPTLLWTELDSTLSMSIGSTHDAREVTIQDWQEFAIQCSLDEHHVIDIVKQTRMSIAQHADMMFTELDNAHRTAMKEILQQTGVLQ